MSSHPPGILRAFEATTKPIALVVDSPHSGRVYPQDYGYSIDFDSLRSAEDAYVDELCIDAPEHGAALLVADFPRAYMDPNRAEDDLNPDLIDGEFSGNLNPGVKTKMGIGLIREKLSSGATIYDRKLSSMEVINRIEQYHRPYHQALRAQLDQRHRAFGHVYHLDMHSMASFANPVTPDSGGRRNFDMVLGDLDGTSCDGGLTDIVYTTLTELGYRVRVNDPYKGAFITRHYGDPESGYHTLQIEMNRALYLDETTTRKSTEFNTLRQSLNTVFKAVASYVRNQS